MSLGQWATVCAFSSVCFLAGMLSKGRHHALMVALSTHANATSLSDLLEQNNVDIDGFSKALALAIGTGSFPASVPVVKATPLLMAPNSNPCILLPCAGMDNFAVGAAYGCRGRRVKHVSNLLIAGSNAATTLLTMLVGSQVLNYCRPKVSCAHSLPHMLCKCVCAYVRLCVRACVAAGVGVGVSVGVVVSEQSSCLHPRTVLLLTRCSGYCRPRPPPILGASLSVSLCLSLCLLPLPPARPPSLPSPCLSVLVCLAPCVHISLSWSNGPSLFILALHQYTYMHACLHACMHTYIHTYIHTYMHACVHTCMHACIHTYVHTYIHACMHACIHTCTYHAYAGLRICAAASLCLFCTVSV